MKHFFLMLEHKFAAYLSSRAQSWEARTYYTSRQYEIDEAQSGTQQFQF